MEKPEAKQPKKITLRDKKKAQPSAKIYFSDAEKQAIIKTVAKNLTPEQVSIYFYQCQALGLNPLLNEICAIPYAGKLSIQVMRDGFLTIAHRSGKFAGMESGVKGEGEKMVGWAKVYHKNFKVPLSQEADMKEYNNPKNSLWGTKPKTMIKKVAESMALRKAFNVSGVYAPEEMDLEIAKVKQPEKPLAIEGGDKPATEAQLATLCALYGKKKLKASYTKQEAVDKIKELVKKKNE